MTPIPSEEEWLAATAKSRKVIEEAVATDSRQSRPPIHPVPQLQGPFEESIIESSNTTQDGDVVDMVDMDAPARHRHVLESKEYERICGRKWRQRPGERYHPLWKLIAQMSFGMHLLAKGLAKSELEVMKILQGHVDELDGFIERTTEDLLLIDSDIRERLRYLKIPLENGKVFDDMLGDRHFRHSIIHDNEKIDHIIQRSTAAMNDSLKDTQKGYDAISALWHYLKKLAKEWTPRPGSFDAVYAAMIGNVEGWNVALIKLQRNGNRLAVAIVQLSAAVSEMQRRVGVASRKEVMNLIVRPRAKSLKERFFEKTSTVTSSSSSSDKPLPSAPRPVDPAIEAALPREIRARGISRQSFPDFRNPDLSGNQPKTLPRRTRSFNDATTRAGRAFSSLEISEDNPATKRKTAKTVAWREALSREKLVVPGDQPVTAPSRSLRGRSRSLEQLGSGHMEGKSQFMTVLGSFVQFEKKKVPPTATREKTKDQLLHHLKSKRSLDIPGAPANRVQNPSRRPSPGKRDWPFSIFRAKSSNNLNGSAEPSEFRSFGDGQSPLCGPDPEHQMTWSQVEPNIPNTHTLKPCPGGSPRIPHPRMSLCSTAGENFDEGKRDLEEEDEVSMLTALPPLGPSLVSNFDNAVSQKPTASRSLDSTLNVHERPLNSDIQSASSRAADAIIAAVRPCDTLNDKLSQSTEPIPVSSDSLSSQTSRRSGQYSMDQIHQLSSKRLSLRPLRSGCKGGLGTPNSQSVNRPKPGVPTNLASLTSESLIDFLAATPPASPHKARADSLADNDLGPPEPSKLKENRSSRARLGLGIKVGLQTYPEEISSPPPPGPGGRVMVTPDYSSQYALEGEKRMRMKRGFGVGGLLISRKRSLRWLFSSSWKENHTPSGIVAVVDGSDTKSTHCVADTGVGSMNEGEIFHFHGMRKDGTWVASN